jgi:hypothetical protein
VAGSNHYIAEEADEWGIVGGIPYAAAISWGMR